MRSHFDAFSWTCSQINCYFLIFLSTKRNHYHHSNYNGRMPECMTRVRYQVANSWLGHDSSAGQHERITLCVLSEAQVRLTDATKYLKGYFHTLPTRLEPEWQKMIQTAEMAPHNLGTSRRKAEVQPWTDNDWNIYRLLSEWDIHMNNEKAYCSIQTVNPI